MKGKLSFAAFLFFFAVPILLTLFLSCHKKEVVPPVAPPVADTTKPPPSDTLPNNSAPDTTFLALGDSYTIGQSVDSSDRFPAQTAALLAKQNIPVSPIIYIATTGWTTLNLKSAIELRNPQGPFTIVTLLIGVNDQYQTHDTTNYRSRFTGLLNTAISLAGNQRTHVFVLSIPDYGVTPFANGATWIGEQIDMFNAINKDVTDSYGISYTDVTTISRADANDNSKLTFDGLHPSGEQYAQWAAALEPKIYDVLK